MVLIYNEIMMEKYDKKGFTLVELIVVIAIIAALSISMGVSTVETLKSTRYKTYRETYKNILDAGKFYAKLKKPADNCQELGNADILCPKRANVIYGLSKVNGEDVQGTMYGIPLCCIVASGLLEEAIFSKNDPMVKSDKTNFTVDRQVFIYSNKDGEVKTAVYDSNMDQGNEFIREEDLENYSCWKGDC